jgi:hypothetical protein
MGDSATQAMPTQAMPTLPPRAGSHGRPQPVGQPSPGTGPLPPGTQRTDPLAGDPSAGDPLAGDPLAGDPLVGDPFLDPARPSWQPRITPSPPPRRGRLLGALLIGLLAGLVLFGSSGFLAGRWTAAGPESAPTAPTPAPTGPSAGPSLPAYERNQLEVNKAKLTGDLGAFADGWLPYVGDCLRNGDREGPKLGTGEVARVACEHGSVLVYFVQYRSIADRDKVRIRNLGQNVDARQLTPGVAPGGERGTPSGRSTGSYVEYAYRFGNGAAARTVAGIWWDDADRPVGAYLLAYWKDEVGESWEPLRDLWGRHA